MVEKARVWAGRDPGVRRWTVHPQYRVAVPTTDFYTNRVVVLSNEGNPLKEKWVALDVYNGPGHGGSIITAMDEFQAAVYEAPTKKPDEAFAEGPGWQRVPASSWLIASFAGIVAIIVGLLFGACL